MDVVTDFHAGLNVLGYRFLPAGAFDANGNLIIPSELQVPDSWTQAFGRVCQEPAWADLFRILGTLTVPNTSWTSWRVGLAFHDGVIRVVVARSAGSVANNEQAALNWSNNFWSAVIAPLQAYAGKRYMLPAPLADLVAGAAGAVKGSPYWNNEPQAPADPDDKAAQAAYKTALSAFRARQWQVTAAVDVVAAIAAALAKATTSGRVLGTVLWYDPQRPSLPASQVRWAPLHQTYDGWDLRCNHYWWNSGCRTPESATTFRSYPFVYSSSAPLNDWGRLTEVAHLPWELARSFYPEGNWPAPAQAQALLEAGDRATQFEPSAVPPVPLGAPIAPGEDEAAGGHPEVALDSPQAVREAAAHRLPKLGGGFVSLAQVIDGVVRVPTGDLGEDEKMLWLPGPGLLCARIGDREYEIVSGIPGAVAATAGRDQEGS